MLWQHSEIKVKRFLEFLNCYQPTITFTANYSRGEMFLDVSVRQKDNILVTDLNIKQANTHQYLRASSSQVHRFKKSLHFSQALRLNKIESEHSSYVQCWNELEVWLRKREYSDKLIWQQVLKFRKHQKKDFLKVFKSYKKWL